ncbi:MAG: NTP transferase domain-containing protein, partial [Anaerolineaceae bacterium]|nr:NTP transferase domain-containing protein [Anaerolineaceae bacterium]
MTLDVPPVFGAVLIGGRSTRMGRPKHLIRCDGTTWLERTVRLLEQVTAQVVILGAGQVPPGLAQTVRLADVG